MFPGATNLNEQLFVDASLKEELASLLQTSTLIIKWFSPFLLQTCPQSLTGTEAERRSLHSELLRPFTVLRADRSHPEPTAVSPDSDCRVSRKAAAASV